MAKSLYCNGLSDVQITNETKKASKRVGIASMQAVFNAKKEGNIRVIKMCSGQNTGVSENAWSEFMQIHDTEQAREKMSLQAVKAL